MSILCNKVRKTAKNQRGVYKYHFADGTVCTLVPGKDGITELDIKKLYALDDSEVYYNNKNLRPDRTDEEKVVIAGWKQEYIKKFEEEHGYEPNKADVDYAAEQVFLRNYNLSIDYDAMDFDKSEVGLLTADQEEKPFEWSDKMSKAMEKLTDKQREVVKLMFVDRLKQKEVAEKLGISPAAVNKHFSKAIERLEKYY